MNGGLTYNDLDVMKRKAATLDEIREYLHGRIDSEKLITVSEIVERAYTEDTLP